jgi:NTE family protein
MIPPRRIALSGGGMKGIGHVGALEVLERRNLLSSVKEYLGTSAGALISFCIVIGYSLSELRSLCSVLDFTQTQNLDVDTILNFPNGLGLDDGKNVEKFLSVLIRAKGLSETITFEEFYSKKPSAPRLRVFATHLDTMTMKEFSIQTPRVTLLFAVRASMAIPFLFTPLKDDLGNLLVDGALISQFPFYQLSDSERSETIGIAFNIVDSPEFVPERHTIITYFVHCIQSAYKHQDRALFLKWGHRIIDIKCNEYISIQFNASNEEKIEIINMGQKAAEAFFLQKGPVPLRRYSLP